MTKSCLWINRHLLRGRQREQRGKDAGMVWWRKRKDRNVKRETERQSEPERETGCGPERGRECG